MWGVDVTGTSALSRLPLMWQYAMLCCGAKCEKWENWERKCYTVLRETTKRASVIDNQLPVVLELAGVSPPWQRWLKPVEVKRCTYVMGERTWGFLTWWRIFILTITLQNYDYGYFYFKFRCIKVFTCYKFHKTY